MVFCYKIITETPRRSGHVSPRRRSPARRRLPHHAASSPARPAPARDSESVLDCIPERDWRLLAALARKREEDAERDLLADQFRRLWERERRERDLLEAQSSEQYQQYLRGKRAQETARAEARRRRLGAEQLARRGRLLAGIQHKDSRARDQLASRDDKKASEMIERALQDEARSALAAARRDCRAEAERDRRRQELLLAEQRALGAAAKRAAELRRSTKRLAICNALSSWESCVARLEERALQAARGAEHAARAQLAAARAERHASARRLAALTAQMRADLRAPPA